MNAAIRSASSTPTRFPLLVQAAPALPCRVGIVISTVRNHLEHGYSLKGFVNGSLDGLTMRGPGRQATVTTAPPVRERISGRGQGAAAARQRRAQIGSRANVGAGAHN
jgi:hypothetical protein